MNLTVWIAGLLALSVTSFFLLFMKPRGDNELTKRIQMLQGRINTVYGESGDDFFSRIVEPLLASVTRSMGHRLSRFSLTDIDRRLTLAGRPFDLSAEHFVALRVVVAGVGAVALVILLTTIEGVSVDSLLVAVIGMGVGWILPQVWLDRTIRERQKAIQTELPGILDVLVITTEAGLNFDNALRRIVATSKGVLVDEFAKVLEDLQLNKPRAEALRDMAERCGVEEVNMFLKSLIQAEKLGASGISKTLRVFADDIRKKVHQRIEEQGNKTAVTMLLPTVLFIMPALFGVVLGPALLDLFGSL